MRTDKMHPLPWSRVTNGRRMSALVDADGKVIAGSLITMQRSGAKERQTHKFIAHVANEYWRLQKD